MSCALTTLKFVLCLLNILCSIFGLLIFGACTFSLVAFGESDAITIPCSFGIALGSLLFLNSILGCCSIPRKLISLYWTYAIIMLCLIASQIYFIFFHPINFNYIVNEVINSMWNSDMNNDYKMTLFEIKYNCCGKYGPFDYTEAELPIPLSCYLNNNNTNDSNLFTEGCITKLSKMYSINQEIEDISDWTLMCLEGISAFFATILAISLKNIRRRKFYY